MGNSLLLSVLALAACGQSQAPLGAPPTDDAGRVLGCEAFADKVSNLYRGAAEAEGIATNLQSDFVTANVHMVLVDCQSAPERLTRCLDQAGSVADLETHCLLPLDEAGTVEGRHFSGASSP